MTPKSLADWSAYLQTAGPVMTSAQAEASARLATVLLCGEQSAVRFFSEQVQSGRASASALSALRAIENEETLHERALSKFCAYLPTPDDAHALKRHAQHFFLTLGRTKNMAQQLARISYLDSAVCKIMWHVENSSISQISPLRQIASAIKADEARHVAVTRRYARELAAPADIKRDDAPMVAEGLAEMLEPLADSFEIVGIDSDRLFARIRTVRRP